jgi:hypothetical protein
VCAGAGLGNKNYVLGPGPDERWAMIGITGAIYNPHTDRAGTLIALSNAGAVSTIHAYDTYGRNAAAASDASTGPAGYSSGSSNCGRRHDRAWARRSRS